jgi:hypothetical protein
MKSIHQIVLRGASPRERALERRVPMSRLELDAREEQYVKRLLTGKPKRPPEDEPEVAARMLERLADSLADDTTRKLIRQLAAEIRSKQ